jgi:hypothetical protein
MRLKIQVILLSLTFMLNPVPPAQAVYEGTPANGSPLVLTLLTSKDSRTSFCSMALITERIVVTAAHCVIEDQGVAPNLRWNIENLYVSQPGADVTKDDIETRVRILQIITRDDFINTWKPEIRDYRTQINDIAFLFLEKPLIPGYFVEIATDDEINAAIARNAIVTHYGYGLQFQNSQSHSPWTTQLPLVDQQSKHLDKSKVIYSREGPSALCPGDSGGPWYLNIDGILKIAAVTVAASGCRGNPPYTGTTLGTRIAPYMSMANSKWDQFLSNEIATRAAEQSKLDALETLRKQAITDGTYITAGGCHVKGVSAELQLQNPDGTWQTTSPALGWISSEPTCPKTHGFQPWAKAEVANGTNLRWRVWSQSWEVFGGTFRWENPVVAASQRKSVEITPKPTNSTTSNAKVKKVTITCTKGKLVKKINGVKPKCPTGWKLKKI